MMDQALLEAFGNLGGALRANLKETYFAEKGPFARHLYPKSLLFFECTRDYRNVNLFGSNRSSKSFSIAFALACWMTGDYPDWWKGWRPQKPVRGYAAGETGLLVRNAMQRYLLGPREDEGAGLIRKEWIKHVSYQTKPEGLAERAIISSRFGGDSIIEFKTYDSGQYRVASDTLDFFACDEEPPGGYYSEAMTRTSTTNGRVICGFTALSGITPLISTIAPEFCGEDIQDPRETSRFNITIGWDDIPESQLSLQERKVLKASYLPHEIQARTTGIPGLGSGMVWPVGDDHFKVPDYQIPDYWGRAIALDPGFQHPTAFLNAAYNADSDKITILSEYEVPLAPIPVHADAIHRVGRWVPVIIDPAGANIDDGDKTKAAYRRALDNPLINANKSITLGHQEVFDRMKSGRLEIFESCRKLINQIHQYVRNEKNKIVDSHEHHFDLCACLRYICLATEHFKQRPANIKPNGYRMRPPSGGQRNSDLLSGIL